MTCLLNPLLLNMELLDEVDQVHSAPPRVAGHVSYLENELNLVKVKNEELKDEVLTLQAKLDVSQGGVSCIKDQSSSSKVITTLVWTNYFISLPPPLLLLLKSLFLLHFSCFWFRHKLFLHVSVLLSILV